MSYEDEIIGRGKRTRENVQTKVFVEAKSDTIKGCRKRRTTFAVLIFYEIQVVVVPLWCRFVSVFTVHPYFLFRGFRLSFLW